MSMPLKYVRFLNDTFIIFSCGINHKHACCGVYVKPESAGFLMIEGDKVLAYGKSVTLEIKSDPTDTVFFIKIFSKGVN